MAECSHARRAYQGRKPEEGARLLAGASAHLPNVELGARGSLKELEGRSDLLRQY
jgi:hypothetical protein